MCWFFDVGRFCTKYYKQIAGACTLIGLLFLVLSGLSFSGKISYDHTSLNNGTNESLNNTENTTAVSPSYTGINTLAGGLFLLGAIIVGICGILFPCVKGDERTTIDEHAAQALTRNPRVASREQWNMEMEIVRASQSSQG